MDCTNKSFDLDTITNFECLGNSLKKIHKNFEAIETALFSLSTCCSLDLCLSCDDAFEVHTNCFNSTSGPPTPTPTPGDNSCNKAISYEDGGVSYPTTRMISLGPNLGTVSVYLNALTKPDRLIINFDNSVVLDTGYYGSSLYSYGQVLRSGFTNFLVGRVDPITGNVYPFVDPNHDPDNFPKVNGAVISNSSFIKNSSTQTCTVSVFAPMTSTKWDMRLGCPA